MTESQELAETVKEFRRVNGLTVSQLANLSGVKRRRLGEIENNSPKPNTFTKQKVLSYMVKSPYIESNNPTEPIDRDIFYWPPQMETVSIRGGLYPVYDIPVPEPTLPDLSNHPVYEVDSFVASSDYHIPGQDSDFAKRIIELALKWKIEDFSVGADLANFSSFSRFVPQRDVSFGEELKQMRQLVELLTGLFKNVYHRTGNHEDRLLTRTLKSQVTAEEFAALITSAKNFHTTSYWYSEFLLPDGSKWMCAHPESISIYPSKVSRDLQQNRWGGYHVITEHSHSAALAKSRDGKLWAISSGCVASPKRLDYVMLKASSSLAMTQGAIIVKNMRPYLVTPDSDWEALARMY